MLEDLDVLLSVYEKLEKSHALYTDHRIRTLSLLTFIEEAGPSSHISLCYFCVVSNLVFSLSCLEK